MEWRNINNSVNYLQGITYSDNIAAFEFTNTLVQSDSGRILMRNDIDWVPIVPENLFLRGFHEFVDNQWTIAIFTDNTIPGRIENFITAIRRFYPNFYPYVYISTKNDNFRRPNRGMWDLFLEQSDSSPTEASFYCDKEYKEFANNIGLAYYTPGDMFDVSETTFTLHPHKHRVLLIMAAHPSQYDYFIDDIITRYPQYVPCNLEITPALLANGHNVIIIDENFSSRNSRINVKYFGIKPNEAVFLMFTKSIQENKTYNTFIDKYANALDYHPSVIFMGGQLPPEPFPIVRIN